jgi:hypothetical protein
MTTHTTWLTASDSASFHDFLATAQAGLRPNWDTELPDGVGDAEGTSPVLSYVVQRANHLAAFQWVTSEEDALVRWELFFVAPASSPARIGLRAAHTAAQRPTLPSWLAKLIPFPSQVPPNQAFPGFLELVALACSHGKVPSTSAAATQALREQEHELEYQRQLSEDLASELRQVNGKLRDVMTALASTTQFGDAVPEAPEPEIPQDLSGLRGWALANENRIVLLPRAFQGAKKSLYEAPDTVYAALELLAGAYRDARMGKLEHSEFLTALAASEMQLEGSVGVSVAGSHGDAYFVSWQGRRRFMDLHLRKGGGRDERYCLRIYFFWDEPSAKVVVGWLPSHLSNSLS